MKYTYLLIALLFLGVGCKDDHSLPEVKPVNSGTCEIAGVTYEWVQIGDQQWITSNLKAGVPYWYAEYNLDKYKINYTEFSEEEEGTAEERRDFERYGNLYEWETACEICEGLGDGWRLPSDEDWQKLEQALGMNADETAATDWRGDGVADLLRQGDGGTKLNLKIAGNASVQGDMGTLQVYYVNEKGYYWTSTQNEEGKVYFRKLHYNSSEVYRNCITPRYVPMMRVRVCRDAQ